MEYEKLVKVCEKVEKKLNEEPIEVPIDDDMSRQQVCIIPKKKKRKKKG